VTPRNPEIWRSHLAFGRSLNTRRPRGDASPTEFPNESRKVPEQANKLLTNGNIT
jgi:hypothetical protein